MDTKNSKIKTIPLKKSDNSIRYLHEIKADRQPIGIYLKEHLFTNHEIKLKKNDNIYMFTDGYPDQIGGKDRKKYMINNFKNLILKISDKSMQIQKQLLIETIQEWTTNHENRDELYAQLDDILIIGIKI